MFHSTWTHLAGLLPPSMVGSCCGCTSGVPSKVLSPWHTIFLAAPARWRKLSPLATAKNTPLSLPTNCVPDIRGWRSGAVMKVFGLVATFTFWPTRLLFSFNQRSFSYRPSLCASQGGPGVQQSASPQPSFYPVPFRHGSGEKMVTYQFTFPPFRSFRSGAVATTSWTDRLLGRLSSYLRLSFIDGINDHSGSEYVRLFKQLVVNSKMSFLDKAKSVVKDAAQKVTLQCSERFFWLSTKWLTGCEAIHTPGTFSVLLVLRRVGVV